MSIFYRCYREKIKHNSLFTRVIDQHLCFCTPSPHPDKGLLDRERETETERVGGGRKGGGGGERGERGRRWSLIVVIVISVARVI